MSKKLFALLLFPLLSLGSCTSNQVEEDLGVFPSIEKENIVTREESSDEKLKLKALYEKSLRLKNEFRSYYLPNSESYFLRTSNEIMKYNFHNLNGSLYYIVGTNSSNEKVSLTTSGTSVWARKKGEPFYIESLPSMIGIPYLIYKNKDRELLGAGSLKTDRQKKSVAYIGPNNDNWFGSGWDIVPTDKGLFIENDMVYTKNDEPATMDNIEKRVLACSSIDNGRVALVSRNEKDATQMFSIVPQDKFHILGIRYFSDADQVSQAIYNLDIVKSLGDEIVILDSLSKYSISNDYNSFGNLRAKVRKMSSITIEKTYTNDTYKDIPVDMYFDKRVRQYSTYKEASGLKFTELSNSEFPLPVIKGETLKYSPKGTLSTKASYKATHINRDLKGVLYLMVSPRTKATIEYTYSVYSVELPYLVFLTPVEGRSDKIACAFGVWKGNLYTEQDTDKHRFHKTPIDSGDDEEIIFEMNNYDLERLGYKENKDDFRASTSIRRRIHL